MSEYYPLGYYAFTTVPPRGRLLKFMLKLRNRYTLSGRGLVGKLLHRLAPPKLPLGSLARLGLDRSTRVLDVGCGRGLLLNALGELGFVNLVGADPFLPGDVENGNGVTFLKTSIHEITGEFDVIMLHHAFEHVSDPGPTLKAVERLLASGGRCIIRIPTVSSYAWEHYRTNWVQLDAPRHFYIHSVESMRILAGRVGLELESIVYDSSSFQFWASEQYAADIPLVDPRSYSVSPRSSSFTSKQIAAFEKRAAELNRTGRGDQAAFYLRKPSVA
jgi:SAM-dependent methyltransferase